jgi:hypothetical protein
VIAAGAAFVVGAAAGEPTANARRATATQQTTAINAAVSLDWYFFMLACPSR